MLSGVIVIGYVSLLSIALSLGYNKLESFVWPIFSKVIKTI